MEHDTDALMKVAKNRWGFIVTAFASGLHAFDWLTDIGFCAISLRSDRFMLLYDGDATAVFVACLCFLIASSLLWVCFWQLSCCRLGFKQRQICPPLPPKSIPGRSELGIVQFVTPKDQHPKWTAVLFLFEDVPQLVFQGIYFSAVGLNPDDGAVALLSVITTVATTVGTLWYLINWKMCPDGEIYYRLFPRCRPKSSETPKTTLQPRRQRNANNSGENSRSTMWTNPMFQPDEVVETQPAHLPVDEHELATDGYGFGDDVLPGSDEPGVTPLVFTHRLTNSDGRCAKVSLDSKQRRCRSNAEPNHRFCAHHLCPRCHTNAKSSRMEACSSCLEDVSDDQPEAVPAAGQFEVTPKSKRCSRTNEHGRQCRKAAAKDSTWCEIHRCPHCEQSKGSLEQACPGLKGL